MEKQAIVTMRTVQITEDEKNETELRTEALFEHKENGCWQISYEESEATGFEGSYTVISVSSENVVSVVRTGSANSTLTMEPEKKHFGVYQTPFGDMTIGILTHKIVNQLSEQGGTVYLNYTIDINSAYLSDNEIFLKVSVC